MSQHCRNVAATFVLYRIFLCNSRLSIPLPLFNRCIARLTLSFLSPAIISSEGCELDQMRHGCRIHNAKCKCGHGCKSEYRYNNTDDCELALKGRRSDLCSRSKPCQNEGSCSQISSDPGFKCRCEGTGFYGTYCEIPCPKTNSPHFQGQFPYECIVI
ncbi:multiple epidermal growth factor-like domains protein 6 isoform X1 [Harpegnathos saltator]|uniref:multiple epidermal growth factor-like domains protein 6 isoform X1 n=1 Tax=Harpegnathos saltator TaxID=610380 RepID=UPI000DBEDAC6|nr:multiple epidermal growth factor-like domains protein 6 isoform X1 [Harpegnathos saltator]